MSATYNAGEVLEIARQLERNGARFYERAADACESRDAACSLGELAAMERKHEEVFASMAADLTDEERQDALYDPFDDGAQYLRAVAGGHVFDLRADPVEWLGESRTMADILRKAISLEKDSIIYYLGVREGVPERLGRDRIDDIIREEMGHVTLLNTMLSLADEQT